MSDFTLQGVDFPEGYVAVIDKPYEWTSAPECRRCWAKFYCSGGCNANNYHFCGDISSAYKLSCQMQKKRLECAIMLKAAETEEI